MTRLRPAAAILLLVAALVLLFTTDRDPAETVSVPPESSTTPPERADTLESTLSEIVPITSADPRLARYSNGSVAYREALAASRQLHRSVDPAADLAILSDLFASYRYFFKANPVGSENAEITSQLIGNNHMQLRFLDLQTTPIDASGALVDRWGSPYFFHPLSADHMGIRSAGPDQKLWTKDDLEADVGKIENGLQLQSAN